jgi:hypothetical protein
MAGTKADAQRFVKDWAGRGNEDQDTQLFWIGFYQDVLGIPDALAMLKFEQPVHTKASDHQGYIDVLVPAAHVIIEQKSLGVPLDKPELRQGRKVTPAQQALAYTEGMPLSQKPRYVVACNFEQMWVYDTEKDPLCKGQPLVIALADLPKNLPAVQFLRGSGEAPATIAEAVSVEAGKIMGRLHDLAAAGYDNPDAPEAHHALSVLMTRLMFLMFWEDTAAGATNAFHDFVQHYDAEDLADGLTDLFHWLDTPDEKRTGSRKLKQPRFARMPYMDGGLFREDIELPMLDETFRTTLLVDGSQEFDWSGVSPTVFGSIFEGALSHDHRRANGQHFTSPTNIHKVIDPLFMDGLEQEFQDACQRPVAGGARTRALQALHQKLGSISVLDPACGSGNFLTESYLCLRRLENRVLLELVRLQNKGQAALSFEDSGDKDVLVSLRNFHGIELEDFACCVARTALWIAEKQADIETAHVTQRVYDPLPLTDYDNIIQGNALRMDWNDVVPAAQVSYVCGNPPFIGYSNLSDPQKQDREAIFGKSGGTLDYVACWYKKAANYMRDTRARCAFVSTNSICQGQQVEPLWKPLFEDGIHIDFAHQTFVWDSQADDEAHVHVIIVGFSREDTAPKLLFSGDDVRAVEHIDAYLAPAPDVFATRRAKPLCEVPEMVAGGKPTDGGFLLLSPEELDELLRREPDSAKWIRPFSMGAEFINGKDRYCLWLVDAQPSDLRSLPLVRERVERVREFRQASKKAATRKKADTPWLFDEVRPPKGKSYIAVPKVSSGRRDYIPMGFVTNGMIPGDMLFSISNAGLYEFGILESQVHNAWMRVVAGRLKSDYRYNNTVVYNNFIWPDPAPEQRAKVESCAQAVLDARASHLGESLADLYDPTFMPSDLRRAHRELDTAVETAYGVDFNGDEEKIVSHLFKLYARKTQQ